LRAIRGAGTGNFIDLLKRSIELEGKKTKNAKSPPLVLALPKSKKKQRA
jgi:hypothetical protein